MDKRSRVMGMGLAILIGQCAVITPVLAQGEQSEADKVFASPEKGVREHFRFKRADS